MNKGHYNMKQGTDLSNEVSGILLVLLVHNDSVLPDRVITFVRLASLQLRDNVKLCLGLLLQVFVEGEGVVLLLLATRFPLSLLSICTRRSIGGSSISPSIGAGSRFPPGVGVGCARSFDLSVGLGSSLCLELGVAFISAPALVNLLVGVARVCSTQVSVLRNSYRWESDIRLAGGAVFVVGSTASATTISTTISTAAPTATSTATLFDYDMIN